MQKQWKTSASDVVLTDEQLASLIPNMQISFRLYRTTQVLGNVSECFDENGNRKQGIVEDPVIVTVSSETEWKGHWDNLPTENETGEKYYYWVMEDDPTYSETALYSGNGAANGIVTITNTIPLRSVTVEKKWRLSTAAADQYLQDEAVNQYVPVGTEITLHLYRTTTAPSDALSSDGKLKDEVRNVSETYSCGTKKISALTTWKKTWDSLLISDKDGNPYYYYVVEENSGTVWNYSISGNGADITGSGESQILPDAGNAGTITVVNEITPTSVTVNKKWFAGETDITSKDKQEDHPQTLTVTLYRKNTDNTFTQYGDSVILNSAEHRGWTYTWKDLPQGEYYIQEESVNGFTALYKKENADGTITEDTEPGNVIVNDGTITITNTKEVTEIEVEKKWEDNNYSARPKEIKVKLYRSTINVDAEEGGDTPTPEDGTTYMNVTVSIDNWYDSNGNLLTNPPTNGYEWMGFHACNEKGEGFDYDKNEVAADANVMYDFSAGKYKKTFRLPATKTENGVTTVYYYVLNPNKVIKKAVDKWQEELAIPQNIQCSPVSTLNGQSVIDGSKGDCTVTMDAKLKETSSGGESGGGEIGNHTLTVMVDPAKWTVAENSGQSGEPTEPSTVGSVTLIFEETKLNYSKKTMEIVLSASNGWKCIIPNAYQEDSWGITFTQSSDTDTENNIIITLDDNRWVTDLNGNVTFTGSGKIISPSVSSAALSSQAFLVSNMGTFTTSNESGQKLPSGAEAVGERTLSDENGWSYKWEGLDKVNTEKQPYFYYIVEEEVPTNYRVTYDYTYNNNDPNNGISKVTITNALDGEPTETMTSLTVMKEWQNSDGVPKTQTDGTVKFELWRRNALQQNSDEKISSSEAGGTYSIDNGGAIWKYEFNNNLPLSATDVNGTKLYEYVYYVKEVSVSIGGKPVMDNYIVSYSSDSNNPVSFGTITIYNREKETYVLPETGGPGTQPYTLGGILLTVMASLLICIKNKRRKEEQGSS